MDPYLYNSAGEEAPEEVPLGERAVPGVPPGAELPVLQKPEVSFQDIKGKFLNMSDDLRVRLMVPPKYITSMLSGPNNELANNGGILFPYTPSISFETKADYSPSQPLHSNFAINFYQRSSVGSISISGKFSVETSDDAEIYLATMHLLKALTRMRSGGVGGDPDSGAPPPICRLYANGESMLYHVPVAVSSFRIELPDSVDYFPIFQNPKFGTTSVPTVSTFAITCIPMYSRSEMQNFSVSGYISGDFRKRGFI